MKPIRRRVKLETGEVVAVAAWPAGSLKPTLGAMKRLEFSGISSEEFQKIQTDFADMEQISAIWPREFESHGISVLDVETRLDNMGLGQEVTKATSGRAKLDRSTENLLAFNASGAESAPWWKVW